MHCDGKKKYGSWTDAAKDARSVNRHRDGRVHPYRCPECRSFHVGGHRR